MPRRWNALLSVLAAFLLGTGANADGQPTARAYKVGLLDPGDGTTTSEVASDIRQGLRDLKYIEGKDFTLEYRYGDGTVNHLADVAAELMRLRVDIIVTVGESAALVAKHATTTIPIVMTDLKQDPVKAGLIASLGRPGGNVTGLSSQSDELWEKRLGLLKEAMPSVSRIIVVSNGMDLGNASCPLEIRRAARGLGLEVVDLGFSREWGLARESSIAPRNSGDAVAVCWDDATLKHAQAIAEYGLTHKLPTVAPLREYVNAGVLMAFGANLSAQRRRAAYYVDRILKGAKPMDLPVERPTLFELSVNLKTAGALGLTLPPALVMLADTVQ